MEKKSFDIEKFIADMNEAGVIRWFGILEGNIKKKWSIALSVVNKL